MNLSANEFDEAKFHAMQRARLCDPLRMQPLEAPWAEALAAQLDRYCKDHFRRPVSPGTVADCFASVPQQRADALLRAVEKACESAGVMDGAATDWATELTVYAALRCLDLSYWAGLRQWQGVDNEAGSAVYSVPSSSLIAAIGMAGMHGLAVRIGPNDGVAGMIDLSGVEKLSGITLEESLAIRLFESLTIGTDDRSRNPYGSLDADEIGKLHAHFAKRRNDQEFAGLYIRAPMLDQAGFDGLARALSTTLNTHVVQGADGQNEALVGKLAITVASLKARVEEVFRMLARHGHTARPGATESAKPAPPGPSATATTTAASPAQAYDWDLFISHASEDKALFVDDLAVALTASGLRVWYDSGQMTGSESLVGTIDEGLRKSRYCLVVSSPNYFSKAWPRGELECVLNRDLSLGQNRVLHMVLNMKKSDVVNHSPMLASRRVVADADDGRPRVVAALLHAINPAPRT